LALLLVLGKPPTLRRADAMDNLKMARQGTSFTQGDISLAWGFGDNAVHEVIRLPEAERVGNIRSRIAAGYIVETDDPVTDVFVPHYTAPVFNDPLIIRLSAPAEDGDGITFNADTGLFDPSPKAANISLIEVPENATAEDLATAFNDLREVLIEADLMEADPS
jgi:hypothetical protein